MKSILLAAALAVATCAPAHAQIACGFLPDMLAYGASELGQYITVTMTNDAGDNILILVNPDTGAWSLLVARGPQACVTVVGSGFDAGQGA